MRFTLCVLLACAGCFIADNDRGKDPLGTKKDAGVHRDGGRPYHPDAAGGGGGEADAGAVEETDAGVVEEVPDAGAVEEADAAVVEEVPDAGTADEADAGASEPDAGGGGGGLVSNACEGGTTLVTGAARPTDVAVDEFSIYVTTADGRLLAVSKGGGEPAPLLDGLVAPLGVEVDDRYAYVVEGAGDTRRIARVEKDGDAPAVIATVDWPYEVAVDGGAVFFGDEASSRILVWTPAGGVEELARVADGFTPAYVAADATHVYFGSLSDDADTARLQRVSRDGGAVETLWSYTETAVYPPGVTLSGIEVTGDVVVFMWGWEGRAVSTVPKAGGEPLSLGGIDAAPTDLAVAGGSVFATDHFHGAELRWFPVDASSQHFTLDLREDGSAYGGLDADAHCVFAAVHSSDRAFGAVIAVPY